MNGGFHTFNSAREWQLSTLGNDGFGPKPAHQSFENQPLGSAFPSMAGLTRKMMSFAPASVRSSGKG